MKLKKRISIVIPLGPGRPFDIEKSLAALKDKAKIIVKFGKNPSANRNDGIKSADTEFVAFVNSHSEIPTGWADAIFHFFDTHPDIDIVGGPQLTSRNESTFARASSYALSSLFGGGELRQRYSKGRLNLNADERHLTSANLICRNGVFEKVMFDERLWPGEDPKFIFDAIKAGFKTAYSPEIYVYHKRRESFKELSRQMFNYGFTRNKKEPLRQTIKKPLFLIPSLFVLYILVLPLLLFLSTYFIIPLSLYVVLNLFFSAYEPLVNKDLKAIYLMPFIFIAIHLSYGVGFIYGRISKIKCSKKHLGAV